MLMTPRGQSRTSCFALFMFEVTARSTVQVRPPRFNTSSLLSHPFSYVSGTVSKLYAFALAERKKRHRLAIDEQNVREVDRHDANLRVQKVLKCVHILSVKAAAHDQDRGAFCALKSFDPAGHRVPAPQGKQLAIRS
jgi:hypothetical protein